MSEPIIVVAAVVERDGRILICQRRRGDRFELLWEFPGGKVKPGETLEEALRRELREELDVAAGIGAEIYRARHRYAQLDRELELVFFSATVGAEAPANLAFEQIVWAEPGSLTDYEFLPADRELVATLAKGEHRNSKHEKL
ncbi:MAG TPA: (deoxy)nucleoside triphosphate pyrophosphohydrolase [Candidatus Acidoferrales bacterium]|nr:(deoxy)nucleoside triphosphate pyrophosphohydrolase [Candidatus Acidoferrales bacterium]